MRLEVKVKWTGPKVKGKLIEPVEASGVKVTRLDNGKRFILEQGKVPGASVLSKETLKHIESAWKVKTKLKHFTEAMPEDFKRARAEAEKRMAENGATTRDAVEIVKESLYRQRYKKKPLGEAERSKAMDSIDSEVDGILSKWKDEFGSRKAQEIIESGYHHGCGDIALVMHHLLTEKGLKTRMIEAVHAHPTLERLKLSERAGQSHVWNEVFQEHEKGTHVVDGKRGYWVPVDASGGKLGIGEKPLEFSPEGNPLYLVPVRIITKENERSASPETKDHGPGLLVTKMQKKGK